MMSNHHGAVALRPICAAILILSFAALFCDPRVVRAQTSNEATARALFAEGQQLAQSGQTDAACAKFEAASKLFDSAGVLVNLGDCYEKLGRTASASVAFARAAGVGEATNRPNEAAEANRRQAALAPRLVRIAIRVPREVPGLKVTRDGTDIPSAAWTNRSPSIPVRTWFTRRPTATRHGRRRSPFPKKAERPLSTYPSCRHWPSRRRRLLHRCRCPPRSRIDQPTRRRAGLAESAAEPPGEERAIGGRRDGRESASPSRMARRFDRSRVFDPRVAQLGRPFGPKHSGGGVVVGFGAGLRLSFLGVGARARLVALDNVSVWEVDGETAFHVPDRHGGLVLGSARRLRGRQHPERGRERRQRRRRRLQRRQHDRIRQFHHELPRVGPGGESRAPRRVASAPTAARRVVSFGI